MDARLWERVATTGARPSWRSLHVGLHCRPPVVGEGGGKGDGGVGGETMLVLGGSDEHVQPFSSGDCADFAPYLLDLSTFEWRRGGGGSGGGDGLSKGQGEGEGEGEGEAEAEGEGTGEGAGEGTGEGGSGSGSGSEVATFAPRPRMRFAAEAYGGHVLLYSGHGDESIPPSERCFGLWNRSRDLMPPRLRHTSPGCRPVCAQV